MRPRQMLTTVLALLLILAKEAFGATKTCDIRVVFGVCESYHGVCEYNLCDDIRYPDQIDLLEMVTSKLEDNDENVGYNTSMMEFSAFRSSKESKSYGEFATAVVSPELATGTLPKLKAEKLIEFTKEKARDCMCDKFDVQAGLEAANTLRNVNGNFKNVLVYLINDKPYRYEKAITIPTDFNFDLTILVAQENTDHEERSAHVEKVKEALEGAEHSVSSFVNLDNDFLAENIRDAVLNLCSENEEPEPVPPVPPVPATTTTPPETTIVAPETNTTTIAEKTTADVPETTTIVPANTKTVTPKTTTIVPANTTTVTPENTTIVPANTTTVTPETTTIVPANTTTVTPENTTVIPATTTTVTPETTTVAAKTNTTITPENTTTTVAPKTNATLATETTTTVTATNTTADGGVVIVPTNNSDSNNVVVVPAPALGPVANKTEKPEDGGEAAGGGQRRTFFSKYWWIFLLLLALLLLALLFLWLRRVRKHNDELATAETVTRDLGLDSFDSRVALNAEDVEILGTQAFVRDEENMRSMKGIEIFDRDGASMSAPEEAEAAEGDDLEEEASAGEE